jgi:hypothetical protein
MTAWNRSWKVDDGAVLMVSLLVFCNSGTLDRVWEMTVTHHDIDNPQRRKLLQAMGYYAGMLAYYWVLATPAVGFLFGCYLYVAVNVFHCHYDEAFSALRIPHYKGFTRIHLTQKGDLVIYALAMDQVPPLLSPSSKRH